jgi:transposase
VARNKDNQRILAKELYLQTNKTLEEIAEIVIVNRTTVSTWCKAENWKAIKDAHQQTPERVVQSLYAELEQLNAHIHKRPEGMRFADSKESDARNKIILSIKRMQNQIALPQYVAVLIKFLEHVQRNNLELSKQLAPVANDFLNDAVELMNKKD